MFNGQTLSAVAYCRGTQLNILQGQADDAALRADPLHEVGEMTGSQPEIHNSNDVPNDCGLRNHFRLDPAVSLHSCRNYFDERPVSCRFVLSDGFTLMGQMGAINGGFLPKGD